MPRLVNHDARRREISTALWRVVRRDGLDAASVRAVAAEAGWSPSAMRHYFTTQDELLVFAMQLVEERVRDRLARLTPTGEPRTDVFAALCEVLPLDKARREENEVWLALSARAQVQPQLRAVRKRVHNALHALAEGAIRSLDESGALTPGGDLQLEADRFHALIDGLAVHAIIAPRTMTPDRLRAVLNAHLSGLAR